MSTRICSNCHKEFTRSGTSCPHCGTRVRLTKVREEAWTSGGPIALEDAPQIGGEVSVAVEEVPKRMRPRLSAVEGGGETAARAPSAPSNEEDEGTFRGDPLIGRALGGCVIQGVLGRGAMGAVYRANQLSLDRIVALKTIREDLCENKVFLERFQQEARTVGRFSTPYVVQIHQVGCDQGTHFIVMEYVGGGNLGSYARKKSTRRLAPDVALRLLRQCCEGLLEAEQLEIVHRDIKPQNLLLDQNGNVKIADFGIAKFLGASMKKMTAGPGVLGTPVYMSPEQAQGKELDHRSDMYSLGATFYHLLTGTLPVDGDSVYAVLRKKGEIEFLSPSRVQECHAPEALTRVIEKMTALYPDSRYASFQEVIDDLDRIAAGNEPLAQTPRIRAGGGAISALAFILVLLCALGLAGVLAQRHRGAIETWLRSRYPAIAWLAAPRVVFAASGTDAGAATASASAEKASLDLEAYRSRLKSLGDELEASPDFETLARVRALGADFDGELQTRPAPAEDVDAFRAAVDTLYGRGLVATLRVHEARLAELRGRIVPGASREAFEAIVESATIAYNSIPDGLDGGAAVKAGFEALRSELRVGIDLQAQLHRLELEETASTFAVPFEATIQHWRTIERRLGSVRNPSEELAAWMAAERLRRGAALAARALPALEELRRETLAKHEKFLRGQVSVDDFESAVALLEESRKRLIDADWVDALHWKAVVEDETIAELKRTVADGRIASEVAGELGDRARRYLESLRAVPSLADWLRAESALAREAEFVENFRAKLERSPGALTGEVAAVLKEIGELRKGWREHERIVAGVLAAFSGRRLFGEEGAASLDALRKGERTPRDPGAQALLRASEAMLVAGERLIVRLDLDGGKQGFQRARRELASLDGFPEESEHGRGVVAATSYVKLCEDKLDELRELVAGMAPVPSSKVLVPGKEVVSVPGFYVDRFEVSVGDYRGFVEAMKVSDFDEVRELWPDERAFEDGRELPRYLRESRRPILSQWPIEEVTYLQALAYLRWRNPHMDLFTLEEWWLATKGDYAVGQEHRSLRESQSSIHDDSLEPLPVRQGGEVFGYRSSLSVHHLADNVAEWCKRDDADARMAPVAGVRYLDSLRVDRVPAPRRIDTVAAGYGFRGVLRVADVFAELIPLD